MGSNEFDAFSDSQDWHSGKPVRHVTHPREAVCLNTYLVWTNRDYPTDIPILLSIDALRHLGIDSIRRIVGSGR